MSDTQRDDSSFDLIELAAAEPDVELGDSWFADRRSSIAPLSHSKSVPPMGDDDVDRWLK